MLPRCRRRQGSHLIATRKQPFRHRARCRVWLPSPPMRAYPVWLTPTGFDSYAQECSPGLASPTGASWETGRVVLLVFKNGCGLARHTPCRCSCPYSPASQSTVKRFSEARMCGSSPTNAPNARHPAPPSPTNIRLMIRVPVRTVRAIVQEDLGVGMEMNRRGG